MNGNPLTRLFLWCAVVFFVTAVLFYTNFLTTLSFVYVGFPMRSHEKDHMRWCITPSCKISMFKISEGKMYATQPNFKIFVIMCSCVRSASVCRAMKPEWWATPLLLHRAQLAIQNSIVYLKCVNIECVMCPYCWHFLGSSATHLQCVSGRLD